MKTKLIIIAIILLGIGGFGFFYFKEGTLPVNRDTKNAPIDFVVEKGEGLNSIIRKLENESLIRNRLVFYIVVKQLGIERNIQAGTFKLSSSLDAYELAESLTRGTEDIWIKVVEGLRKEEVAEVVAKELSIDKKEFIAQSQEGYLFPDTYLVPKSATAIDVIKLMRDNFNSKYTQEMRTKGKQTGLKDTQIITLASLVEREGRTPEDRQEVANIMLKRIKNEWPLQVDATIQYALGYQPREQKWWKTYLSIEDLALDSPYNSYKNTTLPPHPICNPSFVSIQSVVNATGETKNWYYLSEPGTGKTYFSETLEQHDAKAEKYLK
ncbi:MAG: endolytic transglycosylase MltG [Candidatus Roizmanbacteria bacterium]